MRFILVPILIFIFFNKILQSSANYNYNYEGESEDDEEVEIKKVVVLPPLVLKNLARTENAIYKLLTVLSLQNEEIPLMKEWIKDYEESTVQVSQKFDLEGKNVTDLVSGNPILVYKMMNRYAQKLPVVQGVIDKNPKLESFSNNLKLMQNDRPWPSWNEVENIVTSLFRIQSMYHLNASEISLGRIGKIETGVILSTSECLELAKFAIYLDYFICAIDWLRVTEDKINSQNIGWQSIHEEIRDYLASLIFKHDDRISTGNLNAFMYKERIDLKGRITNTEQGVNEILTYDGDKIFGLVRSISYNVSDLTYYPGFGQTQINFMALCNGAYLQTNEVKSKLTCWFDNKKHPYWTIKPLKLELLNLNPVIIQAYDIIGDNFIDKLKEISLPMLEPPPPITNERTTLRSAMYAWHDDEKTPETENFIKKIEYITGLNAYGELASTSLQVANYAFGGYVATHWDSLGDDADESKGDRLLTALFYLNEVEQGGLTAFPLLGISVEPVKGSGVFWYLSWRDGEVDRRVLHGACPILTGEKWIATKWIHMHSNMFKWPCLRTT